MAIRQARSDEILMLAKGINYNLFPPIWLDYFPQLTWLKVLSVMDSPENDQEVESQLDKWHEFGRSTNNFRFMIEVLALQALLLRKQGKDVDALKKMRALIALAEPRGFIRTFVDLGKPMNDLLKRLQKENFAVDYIETLLSAFSNEDRAVAPESVDQAAASADQPFQPPTTSHPVIDPLTNRELDVLELLALRLQNKEIAEKLFISEHTVKGHLKKIYQKLDVTSRQKAVVKAYRLGVILHR